MFQKPLNFVALFCGPLKAFEAWKGDKDEQLKEQHKKKIRAERKRTTSVEEEKDRKQREAQSAFKSW